MAQELFDGLDEFDEDVVIQLDNLGRQIDGLDLENQVFEDWLKLRSDAELAAAEGHDSKGRGRQKHGRSKLPQKLAIEYKCDIANSQLEQKQKEMDETKKHSEKLIDTLKAVLEETDIRIAELKKDAYEFKRDIVVGAENMRTGKTMAEKVQKYMEDKLKNRDSMIDKLKLKNVTIKAQIQKVENQLKQKEEMGDVLHYIDFHQLQIENKQYVSRIEERNDELLKLKMTTGATVQTLNSQKEKLSTLQQESEWLQREIKSRTDLLAKVRDDNRQVSADIANDRRSRKRLSQQQSETADMPQVLDYVSQKAELYELQDALANWERKVEIMEMAAKRARSLRRLQSQSFTEGMMM
mmetsp:Transcript_35804/g.82925  ORF Transcript_35804/g.82925 Transcript_35804/m.82925 type:complete len:353 (-) Transcript_35804:181-1239(-)